MAASFKEFIAENKEGVYRKICEYLPSRKPEFFFKEVVPIYIHRKGQYRRPSYLLLWSLLYGGTISEALLPAAIQQVSEDWILVHDDMLDNNKLRRGLPSAHSVVGSDYAMIGGDALHAVMWKMARDAATSLGKERGDKYFEKLYDMLLTTMAGQYIDTRLTKEIKDIRKFTLEDYYESIFAKSAYYTIYGPMQCGAIVAGASQEQIMRIPEYGIPIGNAFQIKDDILDCESSEQTLGKSIGNDVWEGTKTMILWHAVQNANTATLDRLSLIYKSDRSQKKDSDIQFVLEKFKELGSVEFAQREADKLALDASKKFEEISKDIPESQTKSLARESIGYLVSRKE